MGKKEKNKKLNEKEERKHKIQLITAYATLLTAIAIIIEKIFDFVLKLLDSILF